MKTAHSDLIALLATGEFVFCDLYEIVTTAGTTLRYTTADADVVYDGDTYTSDLFFDHQGSNATAHWKTGLDVDTWQVHVMPLDADPITGAAYPILLSGQPWLAAVAAGALDGATVDIHRAYWADWPTPWATPLQAATNLVLVDYFAGHVAACDLVRNYAVLSINSWMDQLSLLMPRNLWQASCRHTLFDAGCALTQASFANSGTAQAGSTQSAVITAGLGRTQGYFDQGQVTMTSGANAGLRRMVKAFDGATLSLIAPFPFTVAAGDGFTAYPGCDKTVATCAAKFSNAINFGGQDLVPAAELAV